MGSKATWETCPAAVMAISRTTVPFLYQTRTLTAAYRKTSPIISHRTLGARKTSYSLNDRSLKNLGSLPDSKTIEAETAEPERLRGDDGPNFVATRISRISEVDDRQVKSLDPDSENISNELKEGHSGSVVRKILVKNDFISSARPVHLGGVPIPKQSERSNTREWKTYDTHYSDDFDEFETANDIRFVDSGVRASSHGEIYPEKDAIDKLVYRYPDRTSTITQAERIAFQRLFADVFTRHHNPHSGASALQDPIEDDIGEEKEAPQKVRQIKRKINELMVDAVGGTLTPDQKEQIVNRYPTSLRAAAARAIGFDSTVAISEESVEVEQDLMQELAQNRELEESQNAERQRVEELMQSAKTDFALWAIMEEEVFPMIEKLGLGEIKPDNAEDKPSKRRGRKSKMVNETLPVPKTVSLPPTEDSMKKLELYGPLYPEHLLFGLRCLAYNFTKPSPLTLSVLSKIKSLGFVSIALGASTQLYNELLKIYWYKRDDFRGVIELLKEMEKSGLNWDAETLSIVEDISREQRRALNGSKGATLKVLWTLPEFAPGVFSTWSKKIRQALQESQAEKDMLPY